MPGIIRRKKRREKRKSQQSGLFDSAKNERLTLAENDGFCLKKIDNISGIFII